VGFSPDAIARATQRCYELFGEEMLIRTMTEVPFSAKDADYEMHYKPEAIPDFSSASSEDNNFDSDEPFKAGLKIRRSRTRMEAAAYACPVAGCPRHDQGFEYEFNLKRHLRKGHKMTTEDISGMLGADSDEEMDGAVHVDGFLKPVLPRKRSKRKLENSRERDISGEETTDSESETGSETDIRGDGSNSSSE
jgi:hypothetical protein